ncbi:MotA/TolQ/ExbB proton channel family protein, partial [Oligoflexia bacterium]|nr:MotA/TolQ/ExbB proton channel family protein [Oligoflexia bacterium]
PARENVDRGVVAGLCLSFFLIAIGIIAGGQGQNFLNLGGLAIVLGGTFGATLVHFSLGDVRHAWNGFRNILRVHHYHPLQRIQYLVSLARSIRRHGLLVLEKEGQRSQDSFLRLAFELTVDGQPPQDVRRVLETEVRTSINRAWRAVQVFETMGNYAPAMGLIGTLIGLIQMLGSLDNPATVGPAMSIALLTTLYGAILANLVFLPIAGKLKNCSEEDGLVKAITIEGIISLGREDNPIVLEQRLQGFLPLAGNS